MIACISQNYYCLEETMNTLNYASRATKISRKVTKNSASLKFNLKNLNNITALKKIVK